MEKHGQITFIPVSPGSNLMWCKMGFYTRDCIAALFAEERKNRRSAKTESPTQEYDLRHELNNKRRWRQCQLKNNLSDRLRTEKYKHAPYKPFRRCSFNFQSRNNLVDQQDESRRIPNYSRRHLSPRFKNAAQPRPKPELEKNPLSRCANVTHTFKANKVETEKPKKWQEEDRSVLARECTTRKTNTGFTKNRCSRTKVKPSDCSYRRLRDLPL
ncbi:hypothetical protein [Bufonid herpesvirus 1]|uniref:hypothetical protein n=1 Tax=Bufonid herpesvirus 1 TaxID=2282206 RepID=UPI000EB774BC|nr:hypothetical protein [Bufonid herpesvirus 1]AXF48613.1 hypothetical protein [Bufonid herpesvirus 1]